MNTEHKFHIEPRDLLFMRDARPMEASDAGLGANWPRPDQIWNAFINAFHARWPKHQEWEGYDHKYKAGIDKNKDSSFRFGSLKSAGPFPVDENKKEIYFPCPLDLSCDDDGILYSMNLVSAENTNIPSPLKYAFLSLKLGKNELPLWISSKNYAEYLKGSSFKQEKVELYEIETIAPGTNTTIEGKFYQAEYLRMRSSTRMAVQLSCVLGNGTDVFEKIAEEEKILSNVPFVFGGQQGIALLSSPSHSFSLPTSFIPTTTTSKVLLRWTLLSPAVYPEIPENEQKGIKRHSGGWLPTWIDPQTGRVMLPKKDIARNKNESREEWRKRIEKTERFSAKLVAARIGKPMAFSGWDLQTGPKPTMLAVPAGSCYIFECENAEEAKDLSNALSWNGGSGDIVKNRRSTIFGEKGFGLGVCSIVKPNIII